MKKTFIIIFVCLLTLLFVGVFYYYHWKPLWSLEEPRTVYFVSHHRDDTLRVVMIGDSWAGMRPDTINMLFQTKLSRLIGRPSILKRKGKGGEKSRGIYHLMFEDDGFGTKPLLLSGADYCVIFAGINDAAANLGKKQYIYYMKLIISFLLDNNIRPVLVEIPNVNIWNVYGGKPFKDLMADYIRSWMTQCKMYYYPEYREALQSFLKDRKLEDSVIYIPMRGWNGNGSDLNNCLFLDDQIHLNQQGYIKMDSCIIDAIIKDLLEL